MTLPLAYSDLYSAGTTFTPPNSNVTYNFTENVNCTSIDDSANGGTCLNISGGDFDGLYCDTSPTPLTIFLGAPTITGTNLTLLDLLDGRQRYNISYNASDVDGDNVTCWVVTQEGNVSLTYTPSTDTCSGEINITQNSTNSFVPYTYDNTTTNASSTLKGVEVAFNQYLADTSQINNLSIQYFLKQYNLTNNITQAFTDIQFSLNSTDTVKILNISEGLNQDNQSEHSGDYLEEDGWVIGGTTFNVSQAYNIYRTFLFNNTLPYSLPQFEIVIELEQYSNNSLAEKQDGLFWPDLNSSFNGTHLYFNLSSLNASDEQNYRYSYDAHLITWTGETSADYRLFGDYKAWTLDRNYQVHFNLTDKTIEQTIAQSYLGEWIGKTSTWTSSLIQDSTNLIYTHTTTDNVVDVDFSFENATEDTYVYQIIYYTPVGSGGGGGGGGSVVYIYEEVEPNETIETIERIVEEKTTPKGYIEFVSTYPGHTAKVPYLGGGDLYKEVVIKAVGGPVNASLKFSDNLEYFTGAICDLKKDRCYDRITINEGEEKYIFMLGNFSSNQFKNDLMTLNKIEGFVRVLSGHDPGPNQYNLTIDKYALFDTSLKVKTDYLNDKVKHKTAYYLTAIGLVFGLLMIAVIILKLIGII